MPIYAYRCANCGHARDVLQKMSDPLLTTCPVCGAEAFSKQVTAAGFQLKGSGWYVTDFRGGNKPAGEPKTDAKGESKGESKGDTADAKPASGAKPGSDGKAAAVAPTGLASPSPSPAPSPAPAASTPPPAAKT